MACLSSMPLWHLADLRLPDGVGDKRIIRAVSRMIGLPGAASVPKRAIQFGSRSSKLFKCNGSGAIDVAQAAVRTADPVKPKLSRGQRRAKKRDYGSRYPGPKKDVEAAATAAALLAEQARKTTVTIADEAKGIAPAPEAAYCDRGADLSPCGNTQTSGADTAARGVAREDYGCSIPLFEDVFGAQEGNQAA